MSNLLKLDELLQYGTVTIVLSALMILVGMGAVVYHGGLLYGIEFTGGLRLEFEYTDPIDANTLTEIRSSLERDGSSVQVNTFGLSSRPGNRGLMVTVRADQLVTTLTEELYQRGRMGDENPFEEIAGLETVRWIDAETLRNNFRIGDGESQKINVQETDRERIRNRVQSIVNESLVEEVVADLRDSQLESRPEIDLNWASRSEIEQWIETQQLNGLVDAITNSLQDESVTEVSDLAPILERYSVEVDSFRQIFSVGEGTRSQLNLREVDRSDIRRELRDEFLGGRYTNVARDIVEEREDEGLFRSVAEVFRLDAFSGVNTDVLRDAAGLSPFVLIRSEMVSPSIGSELITKSALAILISLFGILIYLYIRFQLTYSLGAIAAIVHDVLITIGLLTLLRIEFDVSVVAAVLTVIGYSLNDTIVNFDRVRENRSLMGYQASWYDVINRSIYEVLNRTIVTSLTTFIAVFVLYLYGGVALRAFSITLIIGIVVGTYSSIFVSNLSLYHLQKSLRST